MVIRRDSSPINGFPTELERGDQEHTSIIEQVYPCRAGDPAPGSGPNDRSHLQISYRPGKRIAC